jgi:hypothetical protein
MNKLLIITMALSALTILSTNQPAEARSHFSLYLGGGPTYVTPTPYYYVPRYYAAPRYHVVPQYVVEPEYYYVPTYNYYGPRYYVY